MLKPRTLEDLVSTIELQEDRSIQESISSSPWAQAFYTTLKIKDENAGDSELASMFVYLVLCSALAKEEDSEKVEEIIQNIREKFFPGIDNGNNITIKFHDPHKKGEDILRVFRLTDWPETSLKDLKSKILSLRQDRNIREKLDDECFTDFMNHPTCVCHCPWHCPPPSKDTDMASTSGNNPPQSTQTKPEKPTIQTKPENVNKSTKYQSIQRQCSQILTPKTSPPSSIL